MDLKQIRALCIESAQTYYSYLSDPGKGCERIAVHLYIGVSQRSIFIVSR